MARKSLSEQIIGRWNSVMYDICVEHATINTPYSEFWVLQPTIHVLELIEEAEYWLSCYYESGHCRCDDRFLGKYEYSVWVNETARLKRLIAFLYSIGDYEVEVSWER